MAGEGVQTGWPLRPDPMPKPSWWWKMTRRSARLITHDRLCGVHTSCLICGDSVKLSQLLDYPKEVMSMRLENDGV